YAHYLVLHSFPTRRSSDLFLWSSLSEQERKALLDLGFLVRHVLAHHRVVLFRLKLLRMVPLVLGGGVEVAGTRRGYQFDFFANDTLGHDLSPQTFSPRARRSASTASIPSLSIMRMPLEETRRRTKRFSASTQKRW